MNKADVTGRRPPLAPGMRRLGKLLRMTNGDGEGEQSIADVERSQRPLPANVLTSLLIGKTQPGVVSEDRVVHSSGHDFRVRIYTPELQTQPAPLIVNYHGGGWVVGDLRTADWMASSISSLVGAVVVSVEYRLAPQYPFPAALEDCYTAVEWAVGRATELGADPARMAIMGESAGGNLAAAVALTLRERSGPKLRHQSLIYPVLDGAADSDSYRVNAREVILTAAGMDRAFRHYVGAGDRLDWRVSPLRADSLSGLPSTSMVVAGYDILRDEGVAYAERLRQAGVPVELAEYASMPHGFLNFPRFARDAPHAIEFVADQLRLALSDHQEG